MFTLKAGLLAVVLIAQAAAQDGCSGAPSTADQIQNARQESSDKQAVQQIGFPAISNYAEKRLYKHIYELRDEAISTYTYILDRNGHFHFLCDSIGYGIPYSTQFTSPQKIDYNSSSYGGNVAIPQADPNGLFSPAQANGTWVDCLNPKTRKDVPLYVEPDVTVSPYKLPTAD